MAPPSNRKNKKRVAESDDEGSSSDGEREHDRPPATERLLAKVDPEYLNTPIDLRQGDAKIRALYGHLKSLQKDVREAETLLSDVAAEMADMLGQENRDEEYNEDAVFDRLKANVRATVLLHLSIVSRLCHARNIADCHWCRRRARTVCHEGNRRRLPQDDRSPSRIRRPHCYAARLAPEVDPGSSSRASPAVSFPSLDLFTRCSSKWEWMADFAGVFGAQTDIWKAYEKKVAEPMEKQKSKTARQKYQTNEGYLGYRDLIWVRSATLDELSNFRSVIEI